jgi:hypothetical protein
MTTLTTNTRTDINARGRQMQKARAIAEGLVWRLARLIQAFWMRFTIDPQEEVAKAERREVARRTVDNLLR